MKNKYRLTAAIWLAILFAAVGMAMTRSADSTTITIEDSIAAERLEEKNRWLYEREVEARDCFTDACLGCVDDCLDPAPKPPKWKTKDDRDIRKIPVPHP
jgi:hypothetical protein